jgi:Protein of unknown function (DUF3379)
MNCLEFHREKLADPRRLSPEARSHVKACESCAAFARGVDETERELEQALATPVPEGLADRVLLHSHGSPRAWRRWALAASVLVALALGASQLLRKEQPELYARLAIEHVVMEPESLTTVRNADAEAFRVVVHDLGGTLKELPGRIRYIRLCPVEDGYGWHVVFETPDGLATLLLVPGKHPAHEQSASAGGWSALARPVRGGYYAIITSSAAATAGFDKMIRDCIVWA